MPATPRAVANLDFTGFGAATPSPSAWEDEVLYFLLVDRFSDGQEDGYRDSPGSRRAGSHPAVRGRRQRQRDRHRRGRRGAGGRPGREWVGGTLAGMRSKLGYLRAARRHRALDQPGAQAGARRRPGEPTTTTATRPRTSSTVDPHFGTRRRPARRWSPTRTRRGFGSILDVVLNHAGDVFAYDLPTRRYPAHDPRSARSTPVGRRDVPGRRLARPRTGWCRSPGRRGRAWPDGAVFPAELHPPRRSPARARSSTGTTTRRYLEGDFFDLKDIHHGSGPLDDYRPSPASTALTRGVLLVDRVRRPRRVPGRHGQAHGPGATRYFASAVHEFAQTIGKDGSSWSARSPAARDEAIATAGADRPRCRARPRRRPGRSSRRVVKGCGDPAGYFALFRNSDAGRQGLAHLVPQHGRHVVRRPRPGPARDDKARFGADARRPSSWRWPFWRSTPPRSASRASTTAASSDSTAAAATICRPVHPGGDVRRRVRVVPQPRPALLR